MKLRSLLYGILPLLLPIAAAAQETPTVAAAAMGATAERAAAEPAAAETAAAPAAEAPSPPQERALGAAFLVGSTTYTDPLHGVIGARLSAGRGGWGVLGLAALGRGGYDSRFVAAAATRRVAGGAGWGLDVLAGGGSYRESGPTGTERSAFGLLAGLEARKRIGSLTLYALATVLRGSYEGEDGVDRFDFDVPRLHLGIGY